MSPYYDPMIAKVIAHGRDRAQALARLATALGETVVAGPHANAAFLKALSRERRSFAPGGSTPASSTASRRADAGRSGARPARSRPPLEPALVRERAARAAAASAGATGATVGATDAFSLGPAARRSDLDIMVEGMRARRVLGWDATGRTCTMATAVPTARGVTLVPAGDGVVAVARRACRRQVGARKRYDIVDVDEARRRRRA